MALVLIAYASLEVDDVMEVKFKFVTPVVKNGLIFNLVLLTNFVQKGFVTFVSVRLEQSVVMVLI